MPNVLIKHSMVFDDLGRKIYYCSKVDGIVRQGLVLDSTDASACIKWGLFNGLEKKEEG